MTTMIERVARAICKAQTQSEQVWQAFLPEAIAAIEAMREPTDAMIAERFKKLGQGGEKEWCAMIDAALLEQQP